MGDELQKNKKVEKIKKIKSYKDFYSFKNSECKIALAFTIVSFIILNYINLFERFNMYRIALQNMSIYIASGLLAMIGVILTGIALMLGLLDKKFRDSIKGVVEGDPIRETMASFKFITVNIGIASILFFCLYFVLYIQLGIPKYIYYRYVFYAVACLIIYYFVFIVFYTIGLVSNTIDLFFVKGMYEDIDSKEKTLYETANEMRIDFLMGELINKPNGNLNAKKKICTYKDIIKELDDIIDKPNGMDIEKKCLLKKYFREYYQ